MKYDCAGFSHQLGDAKDFSTTSEIRIASEMFSCRLSRFYYLPACGYHVFLVWKSQWGCRVGQRFMILFFFSWHVCVFFVPAYTPRDRVFVPPSEVRVRLLCACQHVTLWKYGSNFLANISMVHCCDSSCHIRQHPNVRL